MFAEANTSAGAPLTMRSRSKPDGPNSPLTAMRVSLVKVAPISVIAARRLPAAYSRTGGS